MKTIRQIDTLISKLKQENLALLHTVDSNKQELESLYCERQELLESKNSGLDPIGSFLRGFAKAVEERAEKEQQLNKNLNDFMEDEDVPDEVKQIITELVGDEDVSNIEISVIEIPKRNKQNVH